MCLLFLLKVLSCYGRMTQLNAEVHSPAGLEPAGRDGIVCRRPNVPLWRL